MKKILIILLFPLSFLFANNDALNAFLDDQVAIESQLLDSNLSDERKEALEVEKDSFYNTFLLYYLTNKANLLNEPDPNRIKVAKLQIDLHNSTKEGDIYAVMYDEVALNNLKTRSLIRKMIHDILWEAEESSKKTFKKRVTEILDDALSHFQPLNTSKYTIPKSVDKHTIPIQELEKKISNTKMLDVVIANLANKISHHSLVIYNTAKLSKFKLFEWIYKLNMTEAGKKVNQALEPIGINLIQVIFIVILLLLAYGFKKLLKVVFHKTLKHFFSNKDDISFIRERVSRLLNLMLLTLLFYFILIITDGIDYDSIWFSIIFPILFTILVGLLSYRITSTIATLKIEKLSKNKLLRKEVVNLSIKVIYGIIFLTSLMIILKIFGVNLTTILSGLGIGGAAIAFAAKDSIANIFGSISVLMGNVFEQGDWIETDGVSGTVVEIGLRATTVRTFDNSLVSIPNSILSTQEVRNWSRRSVGRRIKMHIGVTYESDINDIRSATSDIKSMLLEHPEIADDRSKFNTTFRTSRILSIEDHKGVKNNTMVYMDEFADSSINILIYCFSRTVIWDEWLEVKEDVMYKICDILEKNNLEFAYPTMVIHQANDGSTAASKK